MVDVDQGDAATLEPSLDSKHFELRTRRRGNLKLLGGVGSEHQSEQAPTIAVPVQTEELVTTGADTVDVDVGFQMGLLNECNLDALGDQEVHELSELGPDPICVPVQDMKGRLGRSHVQIG